MNGIIVVGYGLFLVAITLAGNAEKLKTQLGKDGGKFVPWIFAIVVLAALSESDATKKLVTPFIALFLIALTIKRFPTIDKEVKLIYNHYVNGSKF